MNRSRFVQLAVAAFGLILLSFVVRGVTRVVAGYGTAVLLSAPILGVATLLVAFLVVRGLLDLTGIRPLE